jgi:hypothetical protein
MSKERDVQSPIRARGIVKEPKMNGMEAAYAGLLDLRKKCGEIVEYWFQAFTFKLADDCRYTPDFVVMLPDGVLEVYEVKGFWRDDAKVKIRVASAMFPFSFRAVKYQKKQWIEESY